MEEIKNLETQNNSEGQEEKKLFTQEEVNELLQKETDRRVSSALKKQEEKNNAKLREAQKLAQMNEQEKYQYELEQREKAIIEKEKALALAENKNEASKILAEKGLSLELVEFVVAEDAETMNANITLLEKAFKASVKQEVEKRLTSSSPKKNLPLDNGTMTKEKFNSLSLKDLAQLQRDNPEIFNQF